MKTFLSFVLVIVLGLHYAAGAANVGVQMDSVTHVLTPTHADFFSKNTPTLLPVVGNAFGAINVSYVSSRGDDTAAIANQFNKVFKTIKAALANAVDNSVIYIMPETYPLVGVDQNPTSVSGITIPMLLSNRKNVTIFAHGVRITGSGNYTYFGFLNCTNCTLVGMTFDLTKGLGTALTQWYSGTVMQYGVNVDITFRNITISGATDQGITSNRRVYGLYVHDCIFNDIGSTNVAFLKGAVGQELASPWVDGTPISGLSTRSVITGCYINRSYRAFEWDEATSDNVLHSGIQITGNTASNLMDYAVATYSPLPGSQHLQNVIISDNIFHYAQDLTGVDSSENINRISAAIYIAAGQHGIIRNNILDGWYDDSIQLISSGQVEDWLIDGNIIQGNAFTYGNARNRGIRLISTTNNYANYFPIKNVTITRNQIRDIGGNGIYVSGANIVVDGNSLYNVTKAGSSSIYRFFVGGDSLGASNIVFRNNFSTDSRTGPFTFNLGVTGPGTGPTASPMRIIWGRGNTSINVDSASIPTAPIDTGTPAQTYHEGRQILQTLSSGLKLVTYPLVKANSYIKAICTKAQTGAGGAIGALYCTNLIAGTSFEIRSTSPTDNSEFVVTIDSPDTY